MQLLEGSGTPVLYIGRKILKGYVSFRNVNQKLGYAFQINPLNAKLNPICHLLALLGAHLILHVSRIRVNINLINFIYL